MLRCRDRVVGGGGVSLNNSEGNPWTADYLKISGQIEVDLRSNIAAEARAKITYERLINYTRDKGTIDALQFLMAREIAHMKSFGIALETLDKGPLEIGEMPVEDEFVKPYFNDSTGEGESGTDERGPWNSDKEFKFVEAPAFQELKNRK